VIDPGSKEHPQVRDSILGLLQTPEHGQR
jgi:hypothetical protein